MSLLDELIRENGLEPMTPENPSGLVDPRPSGEPTAWEQAAEHARERLAANEYPNNIGGSNARQSDYFTAYGRD